ncbi:DUF262 domain-containing protein [Alphaproteobacteria bacterium]|nr:DUF262 domain-containing protein [Alphaproteobacteria bacterium]
MKIDPINITVRELYNGYEDNGEDGVVSYYGKLDIRPQYQREFVYSPDKIEAVINTVSNKYPLNVMYWNVKDDGNFEIIDGQQRTLSICQFINGDFSSKTFNGRYWSNLYDDEQEDFLNYKLQIYKCSGTDSERLKWFETINIAGLILTKQELKNAQYAGNWVSDAKRYFSKRNCPAFDIGKHYVAGSPDRQEYLETAIKWINGESEEAIKEYMGIHQHDKSAEKLWEHFQKVIDWINSTFTNKRSIMKGVDWGFLYNKYNEQNFNPKDIEDEIIKLISDDIEITNQKGIYSYILTREEKYLSLRKFSDHIKNKVYEKQKGICPGIKDHNCGKHFELNEMEADHITPWRDGGKTIIENCQMLCKKHNRIKSSN